VAQLVRHQIGAILLDELRQEGLGVRDLFQGRQEPLSWHFRGLAYDQSELDILESGAVEMIHAPSALVELVVDEMALACANLGREGVASYLALPDQAGGGAVDPDSFRFHPDGLLGYLTLDAAPPARWLEEREAAPAANEQLASRLAEVAHELGEDADDVEVHIEGSVDAGQGWSEMDEPAHVRPAGVSLYFSFDIPLDGATERRLAHIFGDGARTASAALESMREVFRD
jgi:hypothetical protein